MNYKLSDIATIVGGELQGADSTVRVVATDSRNHCSIDSLFVAINGVNHDGHNFVNQMIDRGVRAFLVEHVDSLAENIGYILVKDSLKALQRLAEYHREQFKGTVVAITGSNGKTIVKEWIAGLWLPENGILVRSPKSYNSQLGVALSLLTIEGNERVAVIEAGISQPGEMTHLERMIHPDVVIFTNLSPAHSENFKSDEHKLAEKEILFRRAKHVIKAPTIGAIEDRNLACVVELYKHLGLKMGDPATLQPVAMRLEVQEGLQGTLIINDSYNSDIASLRIALDFARRQSDPKRPLTLILSDILQSAQTPYQEIAQMLREYGVSKFVGVGEGLSRHRNSFTDTKASFYTSTEEFLQQLSVKDFSGNTILIKGSRPYSFERVSATFESRTHTTILEVNLSAMARNLNRYRSYLKRGVRTMAMVKASGYGTGSGEVARLLQQQGVDFLAVAFADEGLELRRAGIYLPIVVLNADNGSFATMIEHRLEPEIYSLSSLRQYISEVRKSGSQSLPIHLKFDTGMHRLGFMEGDLGALCQELQGQNTIYVSSMFSHLAASDMAEHDDFTRGQIELFTRMCDQVEKHLQQSTRPLRHICNTSGIERFPWAHFDMVRVGIGLYSDTPTGNETVCRLLTRIVQIKDVPRGETVGYCRYGDVGGGMRIAVLPIGYADGLSRVYGRGAVGFMVDGVLCPTVGNVCMDTVMIDVGACSSVHEGMEVEVFGLGVTVGRFAEVRGTIDYEVLTSVSSRIRRVYVQE